MGEKTRLDAEREAVALIPDADLRERLVYAGLELARCEAVLRSVSAENDRLRLRAEIAEQERDEMKSRAGELALQLGDWRVNTYGRL